jgi:hypothetical protein
MLGLPVTDMDELATYRGKLPELERHRKQSFAPPFGAFAIAI